VAGLKVFEIGGKYYFEDPGPRNVCVRNPPPPDTGKLAEQAVYFFLIQRGYTVYVGKNNAAEKQGARLYVQAAWHIHDESTRRREFDGLEVISNYFPKYVVTMGEGSPRQSSQGIRWMNPQDFLVTEL
jgi:predicted AAA+ superfamily ATPase